MTDEKQDLDDYLFEEIIKEAIKFLKEQPRLKILYTPGSTKASSAFLRMKYIKRGKKFSKMQTILMRKQYLCEVRTNVVGRGAAKESFHLGDPDFFEKIRDFIVSEATKPGKNKRKKNARTAKIARKQSDR
jgi:hypothetical protein